jgi:hypothetical protein
MYWVIDLRVGTSRTFNITARQPEGCGCCLFGTNLAFARFVFAEAKGNVLAIQSAPISNAFGDPMGLRQCL